MKSITFLFYPCILLLALGLAVQGEPDKGKTPNVDCRIQMEEHRFGVGDPLPITLTLKNTGAGDVTLEIPGLTSVSEWNEKQVVTFLKVISPQGDELSHNLRVDEPGPPLVIVDEKGKRQQVTSVTVFSKDKATTVVISDLAKYFAVTEKGKYSVRAIVPIAVYRQSFANDRHPNKRLGKIGDTEWSGVVESNTEVFEIR